MNRLIVEGTKMDLQLLLFTTGVDKISAKEPGNVDTPASGPSLPRLPSQTQTHEHSRSVRKHEQLIAFCT